jgi:ABC-type Fe3+ transport system substrate-binding protein
MTRVSVLIGFIVLLGLPLVFQPSRAAPAADARRLIIITPHNEQIRYEFAQGFDTWHREHYGEPVSVVYNVPGGTSEIRRMLQAQFTARIEAGLPPGGDADLLFGGGSYEHDQLRRGVTVTVDGEDRTVPISEPIDFSPAWLEEIYGINEIGDGRLYDPDRHWFGLALSGFGVVFNRDALARLDLDEPTSWADLGHPRLRGWVALVNPTQSGSITTAFEAILRQRGWIDGWRVLRRAAANARYFSARSLKPPTDVSQGNAAAGVCIDFFGRYEAQAMKEAGSAGRVGYVDPPGETMIDADPISLLRNAPHPEIARRFIEFCLDDAGQALWQFPVRANSSDGLGPRRFELRRLPVRRSMFREHFDRMIDRVNPYEVARPAAHPNPSFRSFIAPLFAGMAMDSHDELRRAWDSIVTHPAYPAGGGIVTAGMVEDADLRRMLELFDALPVVRGPDGASYALDDESSLGPVRAGWLKRGWNDKQLWAAEADPGQVLRRQAAQFFRGQYEQIVRIAAAAQDAEVPHD